MNHRHRKILHKIFAHPVNANLSMKEIEHVMKELGGEINNNHSGKLHVALRGHSANFSQADHSLPKQEVTQVRKFLETCEINPERDYPL